MHLHGEPYGLTLKVGHSLGEAPMTVAGFVAIGGVLTLVLLAVVIGSADSRARRSAWKRIACRRRELGEWERQLIRAADSAGCPACRLRREREGAHDMA
jgi:hypothetical protein